MLRTSKTILMTLALVALASSAAAQTQEPHAPLKWPTHLAIGAALTAHFADMATTGYGLGRGGVHESNPFLRGLSDAPVKMALTKGGIAVGMAAFKLALHEKHPRTVLIAAVAETVIVGYIAHRNSQLIEKGRP